MLQLTDMFFNTYLGVIMFKPVENPEFELRKAAANGNLTLIKALLKQHPNIDIDAAGPESGQTALHRACKDGHENVAIYLILNGAQIHKQDSVGVTPCKLCESNTIFQYKVKTAFEVNFSVFQTAPILKRFTENSTHEVDQEFNAKVSAYNSSITPDFNQLKKLSHEARKCENQMWALKVVTGYLELAKTNKIAPSRQFTTFACFLRLCENMLLRGNDTPVELIQYNLERGGDYLLVVNRSKEIFALHEDHEAIVVDCRYAITYRVDQCPPESSLHQYKTSMVRGLFLSNRSIATCDAAPDLKTKYLNNWQEVLSAGLKTLRDEGTLKKIIGELNSASSSPQP